MSKGRTSVAQGAKILIVDDEELLAENLMTHLRRGGWEVRIAHDGTSALDAATDFFPDLILVDYKLPDMTGFQLMDAIRGANICCGYALMTAHPLETVLPEAQRRGIGPILTKPFAMAGLGVTLRGALRSCAACLERRANVHVAGQLPRIGGGSPGMPMS
jgi:DNA-binding response OmpR family regulator